MVTEQKKKLEEQSQKLRCRCGFARMEVVQHERFYMFSRKDTDGSLFHSLSQALFVSAFGLWPNARVHCKHLHHSHESYALGTRTLIWFGHGCSGDRMLLEHERYCGLGMDAVGNRTQKGWMLLWSPHGCSAKTPCVVAAVILRPRKVQKRCSCHAGQSQSQGVWAEMHFFARCTPNKGANLQFPCNARQCRVQNDASASPLLRVCFVIMRPKPVRSLWFSRRDSCSLPAFGSEQGFALFDGFCASSDARAEPSVMRLEHPCIWSAGLSSLGCWYHPKKRRKRWKFHRR